jgi:hypothetical protein
MKVEKSVFRKKLHVWERGKKINKHVKGISGLSDDKGSIANSR